MNKRSSILGLSAALAFFLSACSGDSARPITVAITQAENTVTDSVLPPKDTLTPKFTPTFTSTPQSLSETKDFGPDIEDFPANVSPLTGLPVSDSTLLNLPAVMLSVPHFPASARPQAGLASAPWLFEIYIGEGMTRFLAVFYGELPKVEPHLHGSCEIRSGPFLVTGSTLGNRTWFDENGNGIQDPEEVGIGGICVTLYDITWNVLETTSTDSNGYYGFNTLPGNTYLIGFENPYGLALTSPDVGFDDSDSDADPATGLTQTILLNSNDMTWDAGYIQRIEVDEPTLTPGDGSSPPGGDTELPLGEVGPIRSMRLAYGRIGTFFQGGCIVTAGGDPSVLAQVPGCYYQFGDDSSVNNALLDITQLRDLAEQNKNPSYNVNYSGNLFGEIPPAGCEPASQLDVFWNWGNQSQFLFDPLSGDYQRFANHPDTPLEFFPQTDRLTGQQLLYNNIIVMFVEHIKYAETKMDINLSFGQIGRADLFRDGMICHIYWNTIGGEYEQATGRTRPIRFSDANLNLFPLAPGQTWVHIFTTASVVYEIDPALHTWKAEFHAP